MPLPVEAEILDRLESLVAELAALIRADALETFNAALGELTGGGGGGGRRRGASTSRSLPKGAKRDPQDLAALTERLAAFIAKNEGLRIEQIAKELDISTRELNLPVKKLIAAKRVSTKGQKRATTYFSGGGGKSAPKRAAKASAPAKARRKTKAAKPAKPAKAAKPAKKTRARAAKSARPASAPPQVEAENQAEETTETAE